MYQPTKEERIRNEVRREKRRKGQSSQSNKPKSVGKVINGITVYSGLQGYGEEESQVWISRIGDSKSMLHYWAKPEELGRGPDRNGTYRSGHARLYKLVTGGWPNRNSHKTWMGWARQDGEPQFFSCTLNTIDGWRSDRATDNTEKKDLNDMLKPKQFACLYQSFVIRGVPGYIDLKDRYEEVRHHITQGVKNTVLLALKAAAKKGYNYNDERKEHPLHFAVKANDFEIVKMFAEAGQDMNVASKFGSTPLHFCCKYTKDVRMINYLVKHGANIEATDSSGFTPIFSCIDNEKAVALFCKLGANVTHKSRSGDTPASFAYGSPGNENQISMLAARGADLRYAERVAVRFILRTEGEAAARRFNGYV